MKISTVELDNAFRQEVNRLRQMLGGQIDAEQALGLVNQTLDQLIQRTLLSLAADDAGLRVGDPLVLGQLGPNLPSATSSASSTRSNSGACWRPTS